MIKELHLQGLLSFRDTKVELQNLNVLIGPNGSGKSNLIEALALLQGTPRDLPSAIRRADGIGHVMWKGKSAQDTLILNARLRASDDVGAVHSEYELELEPYGQGFQIQQETLAGSNNDKEGMDFPFFLVIPDLGSVVLQSKSGASIVSPKRSFTPGQSILREFRDPESYPEITYVARKFDGMRLYRELDLGRSAPCRKPQPADLPNEWLDEDGANLALVLNRMEQDGSIAQVEDEFRKFYPQFDRFSVQIHAGTVQLYVREKGLSKLIPATRLSDGTMRYLCLLTILCHPTPPPLVAIEEPELGMHPDVLPHLAELLQSAAERTQVVVTTHSDILVDALSNQPESVVICEKDPDGQTTFRRLAQADLAEWLDDYRLGQLWRKGELGGTRW